MSVRVTYTGKDGARVSAVYPNERLASMFARTVREAVLEACDVATGNVNVVKCPSGTPELQRAATRAHHETDNQREARLRSESRADDAVHSYEREAEFWGASRAAGQSQDDAFADFDFERSRGNL